MLAEHRTLDLDLHTRARVEKTHVKPAGRESRSANRHAAEAGIFRENESRVLRRSQSLCPFDSVIEVARD